MIMVGGFVVILIAMAIGNIVGKKLGKDIFTSSKPSQQQIEAKLIEGFTATANSYRPKLPLMLDADTRSDSVTVGPGARVVYHQTLIRYSSRDIDAKWILTELRPQVVNSVCSSKGMKPSLQQGEHMSIHIQGTTGFRPQVFQLAEMIVDFQLLLPR